MAKIRFTANAECVVFGEIEADTLEECREKLRMLDLSIISDNVEGGTKDVTLSDVDEEVIERKYKVRVTSVNYSIPDIEVDPLGTATDDEIETAKAELNASLPQEFEFEVECKEDDIEYEVEDQIYVKTNKLVDSFEYTVIDEEK